MARCGSKAAIKPARPRQRRRLVQGSDYLLEGQGLSLIPEPIRIVRPTAIDCRFGLPGCGGCWLKRFETLDGQPMPVGCGPEMGGLFLRLALLKNLYVLNCKFTRRTYKGCPFKVLHAACHDEAMLISRGQS